MVQARNPEKVRAANLRYYEKNRERLQDKQRTYYKDHAESRKAYSRRYVAENPDVIAAYRVRTKDRETERRLQDRYGISLSEYRTLLESQQGICAICGFEPTKALHVDHDHQSGVVRGLLCSTCNQGLGFFKDNPQIIDNAAQYLRKYFR